LRPLYETQKNLNVERDVATLLEDKWKCSVVKMPIKYGLDFTLTRNGEITAFCEIKCRNYNLNQLDRMGGYFISLGKFISAKTLVEFTKLPFFLVLKTTDGIWYRKFTEFDGLKFVVNGRKDRGDWQDVEPMVLLETKLFNKV
jgi:hypothetical protein